MKYWTCFGKSNHPENNITYYNVMSKNRSRDPDTQKISVELIFPDTFMGLVFASPLPQYISVYSNFFQVGVDSCKNKTCGLHRRMVTKTLFGLQSTLVTLVSIDFRGEISAPSAIAAEQRHIGKRRQWLACLVLIRCCTIKLSNKMKGGHPRLPSWDRFIRWMKGGVTMPFSSLVVHPLCYPSEVVALRLVTDFQLLLNTLHAACPPVQAWGWVTTHATNLCNGVWFQSGCCLLQL